MNSSNNDQLKKWDARCLFSNIPKPSSCGILTLQGLDTPSCMMRNVGGRGAKLQPCLSSCRAVVLNIQNVSPVKVRRYISTYITRAFHNHWRIYYRLLSRHALLHTQPLWTPSWIKKKTSNTT